jgi:hypothetical protein
MEDPEHIWLICGYAGSGKDTAAGILAKNLARSSISSFASAVKDFVARQHNLERQLFDTQEGKRQRVDSRRTIRDLLIEYAESEKLNYGDLAIWARRLNPPANTVHWILSDWRFLAELDCFRERFPKTHIHTIRIVRNGVVPLETETEHELDGVHCDVVLDNSSSRIALGNQIESKIHGVLEQERLV